MLFFFKFMSWKNIEPKLSVWFFDATGSVIAKLRGQSMPFLYSIVCYDEENKIYIPVCEFLTTLHTQSNITRYLTTFNYYFKKTADQIPGLTQPKIIVTDFSWALINSALKTFNNFEPVQYLIFVFSRIIQNLPIDTCVVLYICSTHFISLIKKKVKKNFKKSISKNVYNTFMFTFTLLQHSKSLNEFEIHLRNIYVIFNLKLKSKYLTESLEYAQQSILERKLDSYSNISGIQSDFKIGEEKIKENNKFFLLDEILKKDIKNIKINSPFTSYFEEKIKVFRQCLSDIDGINQSEEKNPFYNPGLFKIIEEKLYIAPFWSSIATCISHLTNNPAEKWFDYVKNDLLVNNKKSHVDKAMPSELTSLVYSDSLIKYNSFHKIITFFMTPNLATKKLNDGEPKENWSDSQKKKDSKRNKGYFFKTDPNFGTDMYQNKKFNCFQETQNMHFKDCFKLG